MNEDLQEQACWLLLTFESGLSTHTINDILMTWCKQLLLVSRIQSRMEHLLPLLISGHAPLLAQILPVEQLFLSFDKRGYERKRVTMSHF